MKIKLLIELLEGKQANGEFEGTPEHDIDFRELETEDLLYYVEWLDAEEYKEWEQI